jgi:hypothetical protein
MRMPRNLRHVKNVANELYHQLLEAREHGHETIADLPPDLTRDIGLSLSALIEVSTESRELEATIREQLESVLATLLPPTATGTVSVETTQDEVARAIGDRPRWRDRDRSLKQSPRDFFDAHYPDYTEIGLTWPDLLKHDPDLYHRLHVHQSRHKSDRIALLTKSQAALSRLDSIRKADPSLSLDDLAKIVQVAVRKGRKKQI